MASLDQKERAERRMQELLEAGGLPPPDEVQYGETCVFLLWHESKVALMIDLDRPEGLDRPEDLNRPEPPDLPG